MDQEQLSNKTNPNTSKTLYPISGIMKYAEGDFDSGCGVVGYNNANVDLFQKFKKRS
jgi:hypothetical protein